MDCPENGIENVIFPSDVRPTMSNYILLQFAGATHYFAGE